MKQRVGLDLPPPVGPEITARSSVDHEHVNIYTYSYWNLRQNITLTAGGSGDFLSGDNPEIGTKNEFNPKIGVTWEPISGTTLRAAGFRALKRTLITNQTLEPTQVAGFNQFFDDINGTKAWQYGTAIDQKFTTDLFAGVEYSGRILEVPVVDIISDPEVATVKQLDSKEYLVSTYLFWTPHQWLALRLQYLFERFELTSLSGEPVVNTNRVPFGFNFFHPCGLSTVLTTTYWNQDGNFERLSGQFESGHDDFWTVDTSINYRLPRRYGFITFGATNLFDQDFRFFDTDIANPMIQPTRTFFGRITLSLG